MTTSHLRPTLFIATLVLTACSGPGTPVESAIANKEKAETTAPPEPVTGKTAFWEMYKAAHAWAPDMLPLTLEAKPLGSFKFDGGKAPVWESTFGSLSRKQFCKFTYSIAAQPPDVRKGVTAGEALPWAGLTKDALAFQTSDFQIDSDEAYKTAFAKGEEFLGKHPDVKLSTLSMGAASRFPGPVWYLMWGDKKLGFFQLVSASTGKALK